LVRLRLWGFKILRGADQSTVRDKIRTARKLPCVQ